MSVLEPKPKKIKTTVELPKPYLDRLKEICNGHSMGAGIVFLIDFFTNKQKDNDGESD